LHLALDTTMLWSRFSGVVVSVVVHGRAVPLLGQTLDHPIVSVSVRATGSLAPLEMVDRLLPDVEPGAGVVRQG